MRPRRGLGPNVSQSTPKSEFLGGVRALSPLLLGVLPFSFVCGVEAINAGMTVAQSLAMNVIIFAGASQLITAQLISENAYPAMIVLTAAGVNLRFMMYSASLSGLLSELPLTWRAAYAYMLSDQAYAVSIFELEENRADPHKHYFFLGAAVTLYSSWQVGAWLGTFVGKAVPESWSLGFAVPLTFLAVVIPAIKTRPMLVSACVAGAVAVALRGLPPGTGLVIGAACGIASGMIAERRLA